MRILVLGAGAIGSILGSHLKRSGNDVCLLDTWEEHVRAINERGLTVEEADGSAFTVKVDAVCHLEETEPFDLVLVSVKSYNTDVALTGVTRGTGPGTRFLTLQNGIGNGERVAAVAGAEKTYVGGTSQGGVALGPGKVLRTISGHTYIGRLEGPRDPFTGQLAQLLSDAGIPATALDDVRTVIWSKLVINVAFNAVTAITGLRNGDLVALPEGEALVRMAAEEAVQVARAKGVQLIYDDPVGECVRLGRGVIAQNKTSMLVDVLRRRQTEIDAINDAVSAEGKRLGVPTPVNDVLTLLVRAVQETYGLGDGVARA